MYFVYNLKRKQRGEHESGWHIAGGLCIYRQTNKQTNTHTHTNKQTNKAIAMMRRKSPPSENILCLIENHCQANISK